MPPHQLTISASLLLLVVCASSVSAQDYDPWSNPEVLRAAWEISLSEDQRPGFRAAVTTFLQDYGADVRKLLRSNNPTDLPRKIARKRKSRVKIMDEQMAMILSEPQIPKYEAYRDLLLAKMDERAAQRRR